MSNISVFLKKNKKERKNTFFPATKSFIDPKTNEPVLWEIKPITTTEDERIREECTREIQVTGKPNLFRNKINTSKYIAELLCASVVFPDLQNAELQDDYGVKTPTELLKKILDDPTEYAELMQHVQNSSGLDLTIDEEIEEVKN